MELVTEQDCPECGGLLIWGGMGWWPHGAEYHEARRRRMYRVVWLRLGRHVWRKATGE